MKSKHRSHALLLALLAALLITTVAGAAPKGGAIVSLSVEQGAFDSTQDVMVTVTISNPTSHTVRILKWFTPLDGVEEPLFAVTRNGEPVAYIGAYYKRPAATGQDYISLKSGESISGVVNLGEYYDLSESGKYEIFYAVASFNLYDEKGNAFKYRDVLTSEKISVDLARAAKRPPTPTPPPPGGIGFDRCTADQQSLVTTAHANAKTYASESENYLFGINTGTNRYVTWFGTFTSSRFNTVKSHFTAISDAFDTAPVVYDCGCKQNYYAYVYPNQPYKIYLCRVFWSAPMTGTDSKAGTLIHEMSHFDVVAGTDDYVYGQSGAMNLAISNPDNAIRNADNHEYFAENTPYRP
jgi:peptidyl-Lys metalloendopeptidase